MSRNDVSHNGDFTCKHCGRFVSSSALLAGVNNRNHCPYCLWSRHLDLWQAGDRLSACKGAMRPVGLAVKAVRKKYGPGRGELMLVHTCTECGKLSANRIAADDDAAALLVLLDNPRQIRQADEPVRVLSASDRPVVLEQLFGCA